MTTLSPPIHTVRLDPSLTNASLFESQSTGMNAPSGPSRFAHPLVQNHSSMVVVPAATESMGNRLLFPARCRQNWQSLAFAAAQSYILAWAAAFGRPASPRGPRRLLSRRLWADSTLGGIPAAKLASQAPSAPVSVANRPKLNQRSELCSCYEYEVRIDDSVYPGGFY